MLYWTILAIFAESDEKMKQIIKYSIAFVLTGLLNVNAYSQDLMARQANMDKQLKAVDSVSLQLSIHKEMSQMVSSLYPTWTNDHVDAYKNVPKPAYFKIDLRDFTMPVPSRNITSNFGYRRRFRREHKGLDIKLYTGDTVVVAFSGKVRIVDYDRRGFGKYVVVRHPNGLETVYGHLSKQLVEQDQYVKSGQPIGLGGNTGFSFGSHLHFETRLLGEPIDPALLFDFASQDVTGDYYIYKNEKALLASNEANRTDGLAVHDNTEKASAEEAPSSPTYHKVKQGDTLYSIALACGLSVKALCRLNGLSGRSKLRIGQILKCK